MVRTPRPAPPADLVDKQAEWSARWWRIRSGEATGDWCTERARIHLREALLRMARGKCSFCESPLQVTSQVEIEHYHPKSIYLELAFEWSNLFAACRACNGAKGNRDHRGSLLKPDDEDPETFLRLNPIDGSLEPKHGLNAAGAARARETIDICKLNRGGLTGSRYERMLLIKALLEADGAGLDILLSPEAGYKLVLRQALTQSGNADLADRDRQQSEAW